MEHSDNTIKINELGKILNNMCELLEVNFLLLKRLTDEIYKEPEYHNMQTRKEGNIRNTLINKKLDEIFDKDY